MCSQTLIPSSPVNLPARLMLALNGADHLGVALAHRDVVAEVDREGGAFRHRRALGRRRQGFHRRRFDLVRRLHA